MSADVFDADELEAIRRAEAGAARPVPARLFLPREADERFAAVEVYVRGADGRLRRRDEVAGE